MAAEMPCTAAAAAGACDGNRCRLATGRRQQATRVFRT